MKKDVAIIGAGIVGCAITLNIGISLQNVIDFLIIALSIFIAIKIVGNLEKRMNINQEVENKKRS